MFRPKRNFKGGFTLVELLVTITIFVILTGVVLFNQAKFNSTILLTNLAYDTALTIRQAQTYGINIKEFNGANTFVPYGVHFEKGMKSFILFADINYNSEDENPILNTYDGDTNRCQDSDGCVNRYNIQRGNKIFDLCVETNGDCESVNELDILFQRPNPDAKIFGNDEGDKIRAIITLSNSAGDSTRAVEVRSNGLIQIGH